MIRYALEIKIARLSVVRAALNGGSIEILSVGGARLALVELDQVSGTVFGDVLKFAGFPKFGMVEAKGKAAAARLLTAAGEVAADGLTVGLKDADIILESIDIDAGNIVKINEAEIRA